MATSGGNRTINLDLIRSISRIAVTTGKNQFFNEELRFKAQRSSSTDSPEPATQSFGIAGVPGKYG
ncbi:hypothetical protein HW44_17710 [Nitrosococcus oceani]|nr:hypothetical protein HW44_17710 [Nitrosococcus oceani]